jgi:hypothetical protein
MLQSNTRSDEMPRALKRRRVRRGTQSCWECKRRKIRCTFVAPLESVCDGCKSRKVKCIGQDFYEDEIEEAEAIDADGHSRMDVLTETAAWPSGKDLPSVKPRAGYLTDARESAVPIVRFCRGRVIISPSNCIKECAQSVDSRYPM